MRFAVLENDEILPAQAVNGLALLVEDRHVELNDFGAGAERRLLRGGRQSRGRRQRHCGGQANAPTERGHRTIGRERLSSGLSVIHAAEHTASLCRHRLLAERFDKVAAS